MVPIDGSKGVEQASQALGINRTSRGGKRVTGQGAVSSGGTVSDAVTLSSEAKQLSVVRQAVNDSPEVRQEKIDAIKQAIEYGTYQVSARELARTLIENGII